MNFYENTCFRCNQTVYQVDKIGPLKDFTFFHQQCFKCAVCGTKLTLRTYFNNQQSHQDDKEVYCSSHVPKSGPGHLDGQSVGIRAALNVPRTANLVNEQIRGSGGRGTFDAEALGIRQYIRTPRSHHHQNAHYSNNNGNSGSNNNNNGTGNSNNSHYNHHHNQHHHGHDGPSGAAGASPYQELSSRGGNGSGGGSGGPYVCKFDASALHIRHALQATELQRSYQARERNIEDYLDRDTQAKLEMRHRKEEDDLYRTFAKHREEEEKHIHLQIQEEWEKELEKLAGRFEQEMRTKAANRHHRSGGGSKVTSSSSSSAHVEGDAVDGHHRALTIRHQRERDDLERNMTLKRDRRRELATRRRLEDERAATAALVERHSREMLNLINEKKSEFMRTNSYYDPEDDYQSELMELEPYPSQPPPPAPPNHAKLEIYNDPLVFADLDQVAINVAQEDQKTFTDLVRMLVGRCSSDVEKARTIFRWITVKNLNTMHFDEDVRNDTPMGLLRGIKHGTESYHVLFKRLCSYVGLHCVVIKGYSKSAGYQPGVKFEDSRFRNSWNAVYVAGAWRFVQCNWGARHLVNAKEAPKRGTLTTTSSSAAAATGVTGVAAKGEANHVGGAPAANNGCISGSGSSSNKSDSLRYEYDDHYFLTDPKEFIYEFFPLQPEWQLLEHPIALTEFQELPFVRSLFFRYGLYFPQDDVRSVLETDSTGAVTVRIGMPASLASTLIFHYNLKFYDSDVDSHDGVGLRRFVMQSVVGNTVAFRVHAPCAGSPLLLDVFANAVTAREYLTGEPMKFKSVCKFKIVCADLLTVMVPLPDCASGEWGPTKALRLFGLVPLTHPDALAFAGRDLDVQFRMSRPLTDFMAALHKNGIEEKRLAKYVAHSIVDDVVTFHLTFPEEGQYGMDIYTRDIDHQSRRTQQQQHHHDHISGQKQLLTHCCKYLINSSKRN